MSFLTNEEYVERNGCCCPLCESDNIVAFNDITVEGNILFRRVTCVTCCSDWVEEYTLSGYTEN